MGCQFWNCFSFWMGVYYFRRMPTASTKCINLERRSLGRMSPCFMAKMLATPVLYWHVFGHSCFIHFLWQLISSFCAIFQIHTFWSRIIVLDSYLLKIVPLLTCNDFFLTPFWCPFLWSLIKANIYVCNSEDCEYWFSCT